MMVLRFTLNEDGLLSIQGEDENHSQVTASREPFEPGKDRDADIYVLEALKHLYRRSGR